MCSSSFRLLQASYDVLLLLQTGYTKTQHCLGQLLWPFGLPAMLYQSSSDFAVLLSECSDDEVGLLWCLAKPFVESKTL
ncbi:hypothetical protein IFM89_020421 [Coptis chinensis]|uniref:Uncharacterized protein n=1 Tax=Coptis chinensis TaxID=261450 RepID=A0A835HIX2_9MAGN|nr:hypothetical protein IFM89_020421 [Coptis chinensis]